MQNYIPFKTFLKQVFDKTFFIVHYGSREYLVPSSVISEEKGKFYRLDDVSDAVSSSIIYQKEENGTVAYVDLKNVKNCLTNKDVTIDQVLTDLESTIVGVLFKNLLDTAIALTNNTTENNNEQTNNTNQIGELSPIHTEESNVNPIQPKPSEPQNMEKEIEQALEEEKPQTNNNNQTYTNKNKKNYNMRNNRYPKNGYKKSYYKKYKNSHKSDK